MRARILPNAIILTKAHRVAVNIMVKGCIMARVLPLRCFLFLLPNYIHVYAIGRVRKTAVEKEQAQHQPLDYRLTAGNSRCWPLCV